MLGVWPVGSGLLAAFPDDPPGFPVTSAGKLHLLLAGLAFVAIAAATIVLSWQMRSDVQWRGRRDLLAAIAVVAILPLLVLPHSGGVAGLCERVFLGLELVCIVVAATPLLRRSGYVRRDETEPARS